MLESIKVKMTDLRYDWQHAPKRQRSSLVAMGAIMVCLIIIWFGLSQFQDGFFTTGTMNETEPQEQQNSDGNDNKEWADNNPSGNTERETNPSDKQNIDITPMVVQNHEATGVQIDRLPRVCAPYANRCEQAIQSLLDAQTGEPSGAKAYLDDRETALVKGETDTVAFSVLVVDANDRQLMQIDMSFIVKTHTFGITNALKPTTSPTAKA